MHVVVYGVLNRVACCSMVHYRTTDGVDELREERRVPMPIQLTQSTRSVAWRTVGRHRTQSEVSSEDLIALGITRIGDRAKLRQRAKQLLAVQR